MGPPLSEHTSHAASSLKEQLEEILEVQRQRAEVYSAFSSGFKEYLDTGTEANYRSLMAAMTSEFSSLSKRALAVESALKDELHRADIANIVRTVQNQERRKLELTLGQQALRAAVEQHRFSWQHGDRSAIGGEAGCCSHVHGHVHDAACGGGEETLPSAAPVEPSEADIKGATKESTQELQLCIEAINDAIAELQELREELTN